ncbi:MAG: hypothetical protein FOGNACKC_03809 [Anaerolineae bacterium]|nr:hypothetical protein [Anaerolineae bacterium]
MDKLQALMAHIEKLSAENQALVSRYVEFLQWQEAQSQANAPQQWSFSFVEAFKDAAVFATDKPAGMDVTLAAATVGGESRPALWAHPPLIGQTVIEFHVPVPQQVRNFRLRLAVGIRDGAEIAEDNLVAFGVKLNGLRVWGKQTNAQTWQPADIPLKLAAGDIARLQFTTEALGSHQWTWAVWGNPELVGTF